MSKADTSGIHRLLDDAFAGTVSTAELQDLKEELRGNLIARAADLQDTGMDAGAASQRAITELGDIDALIASFGGPDAVEGTRLASPDSVVEIMQRNRVRPKPGFVVRTVILSLLVATGVALVTLGALGVISWPIAVLLTVGAGAVALPAGVIVADSLRQETSQHFASPTSRAAGFGLAAVATGLGLTSAAVFVSDASQLALLVAGIVLVVAAIVAFTWLGVTQTNRMKPWALAMQRHYQEQDPFADDPAAAARFGMYTVVIWLLALAGFAVLSVSVGFAWSWLALVGGLVIFMLTLAKMVFPAKR